MSRTKIDYGIDLGTTNSAISRMENGEPKIIRTASLKDTMPSCVYINKKKNVIVGDKALNSRKSDKLRAMRKFEQTANSFIEFKRTMGTNETYHSSNMGRDFSSEELSGEVLKTLKSFVTDEPVKSVVITVPAMFTVNQKDATRRATQLSGFQHVELLQEPIAASIAYGLDSKNKDGYWLVFDFGGGTFDAALLRVEDGIMKVIDTEGDNYLGGKNLDFAIVDEIIIPYLQENFSIDSIMSDSVKKEVLREAMKFYAEETKIQLSFNETHNILSDLGDIPGEDDEGEDFELDITVTQDDLKKVLSSIFQKAVDVCKDLLQRNNLSNDLLDSLILVGGPTYSPILRKMLEEQIIKPDTCADPMIVVAKGAALYASTIDSDTGEIDPGKVQLELGYEATTVELQEFVTVKLLKDKTKEEIPDKLLVDIVRSDKAWSSGKQEVTANGDIIEVKLNEGKSNLFNVIVYNASGDVIPCQPDNFSILQGTSGMKATLPYNIGIEIKSRSNNKLIFKSIKGLEKNQSTPATGTIKGLTTQKQIRPAMKNDFIKIPIYQGAYGTEGSSAINNEHVYDVIISGEDLPKLLPENSEVELTVKVDRSEKILLSAFFPVLEYATDIDVPVKPTEGITKEKLNEQLEKAHRSINILQQDTDNPELSGLENDLNALAKDFENGGEKLDTRTQVLGNLRKILRRFEEIEAKAEWPKTEEELKDVFYRLEETNQKFGNDKTNGILEQYKEKIPEIIKDENVKFAQEMIDNMRQLDFAIRSSHIEFWIGFIHHFKDSFDMIEWEDKERAKTVLDEGFHIIANNPSIDALREIIQELFKLQVEGNTTMPGFDDTVLEGS